MTPTPEPAPDRSWVTTETVREPAPTRTALIAGTVMLLGTLAAFVALEVSGHGNPMLLTTLVPVVAGVLVARSNGGLSAQLDRGSQVTDAIDAKLAAVHGKLDPVVAGQASLAMAVEQLQRDVAVIARATNGELTDRIDAAVARAMARSTHEPQPGSAGPEFGGIDSPRQ